METGRRNGDVDRTADGGGGFPYRLPNWTEQKMGRSSRSSGGGEKIKRKRNKYGARVVREIRNFKFKY